ncbi:MAG: GFA family protein [Alphaproteobacteria bacterium]
MHKGSCLCGAVRFTIEGDIQHQPEACHCSQCRKQSGHFFVAVNVERDQLTVEGAENVGWYRSSEQVERGFCSTCGASLFWKPLIDGYDYTAVMLGAFDTPTGMRIAKHIFVDDKGDYYDIDDGAPQSKGY